jgi:DNA-directed RNA polymerase specialized sigma24 family protein
MDRLYRLSLLLTADPELAEKCFVRGLEDSRTGNPVFKEWARSWARRTIITNAIRMVGPRPGVSQPVPQDVNGLSAELAAVLGLDPFDRFVFVMSVLEGYSDRDCRLLLDCSSSDIGQARARALQHLGDAARAAGREEKTIQITPTTDDQAMTFAPVLRPHLAASV